MPTDEPLNNSSNSDKNDGAAKPKPRGRPKKITIKLDPELTGESSKAAPTQTDDPDPSKSLDEYRTARLEAELNELRRQYEERKDLHGIRTRHAWLLFYLTVAWVVIVWLVILLQGFGQWFFPTPPLTPNQFYLKFKLSDTVIVAFMTSTTATVLGLYGIAAYWMYGNGKVKKEKGKAEKRGKPASTSKKDSAGQTSSDDDDAANT
jgi:hypothetical protein